MPNIITHTIFAQEVEKEMNHSYYRHLIQQHKEEYYIGTNGPDFLFFYGFYPFWKKQEETIPRIGTKFHHGQVNQFYACAIQQYLLQKPGVVKDAMGSYLIGHYLHWQLDSIMHPYVVYKTGFKDPMSKYYHHRMESMMDTIVLKRMRNTTIKQYRTFEICQCSPNSVEAISNIYVPCTEVCFQKKIDPHVIEKALKDWQWAQRMLYDPSGLKYYSIKLYEWFVHKPWLFSGNIVRAKEDTTYDVMNDAHDAWQHPCTGSVARESVMDLLERAKKEAQIGLPLLFDAMSGKGEKALLAFIGDKTYANGISDSLPRQYKKVIYE